MPSALSKKGTAARLGVYLLVGGGVLTLLGVIAPHSPHVDVWGFVADAIFQFACAAALLILPARIRRARWIGGMVIVGGILAVTAAVYFNGERMGGRPGFNEFFYVWPAFYIGYFFRPRGIAASLALITVLYTAVIASIGGPQSFVFTRWIITISVVAGAALAMHFLRRRIDRLVFQLRGTARTDSLTGLLNRRGFDERFTLELERARRTGDPVTLVVADLDRFKELNDRFGHPAGDAALTAVAEILATGSRAIDTVARIGGEEFALLLPATDRSGAFELAERLRRQVAGKTAADGHPLTVSFGIVASDGRGETEESVMDAADSALYAAKRGGRDRTVLDTEVTVA